MRLSAHQFSFVAVDAANVLHVFEAHLLEHRGGLPGAGATLAVDVEGRVNVVDMIDDKVNTVQRNVDAAFDVAGLVLGAGSDIYEVGAGSVPVFVDGGVDILFVKERVQNTHGNLILSAVNNSPPALTFTRRRFFYKYVNLPSVYHELHKDGLSSVVKWMKVR